MGANPGRRETGSLPSPTRSFVWGHGDLLQLCAWVKHHPEASEAALEPRSSQVEPRGTCKQTNWGGGVLTSLTAPPSGAQDWHYGQAHPKHHFRGHSHDPAHWPPSIQLGTLPAPSSPPPPAPSSAPPWQECGGGRGWSCLNPCCFHYHLCHQGQDR